MVMMSEKKMSDNRTRPPLGFDLLSVVEKTFPIPDRFRAKLPGDIAELSRLLTSARGERNSGYLNQPAMLTAYMRYFLPWNVFRLQRLFALGCYSTPSPAAALTETGNLIVSSLLEGDAITDLGSGPLTLPIALWLSFPQLRKVPLEFRCVDKSSAVLDAGNKLWKAIVTASGMDQSSLPWKIKPIHASIEDSIRGKAAKFVCAFNVFNEIFYKDGVFLGNSHGSLKTAAKKAVALLEKNISMDGAADNSADGAPSSMILVAEPGNPQGGAFIAALRDIFLQKGLQIVSPCLHAGVCPFPGTGTRGGKNVKAKWCHFAFATEVAPNEAPLALRKLSAAAGIPKERATMSFMLAGKVNRNSDTNANPRDGQPDMLPSKKMIKVRIISDMFPLSQADKQPKGVKNNWARYGCCELGMALVSGGHSRLEAAESGTLLELPLPQAPRHDGKSGALILPLSF
jgi:hypothetical protein